MDYKVVGDNEVEISRDGKKLGIVRQFRGEWQYGTFDGDEPPEHWIVVEQAPFAGMIGITEVIPKVMKFLNT